MDARLHGTDELQTHLDGDVQKAGGGDGIGG